MGAISPADSASGGFLAPASDPPAAGLALGAILQETVSGITGIPGDLVLPRWQDCANPRIPDRTETWCAVEANVVGPRKRPSVKHDGSGQGASTAHTVETIVVEASFYGPDGEASATGFIDGLWFAQNREALFRHSLFLMSVGEPRVVPEIVAMGTRRRTDVTVRLTRRVVRTYPIRNVVEAGGTFQTENHGQTWSTEN